MQYLSEAWITAADQAVRAADATAPIEGVTIDQFVGGATNYRVVVARGSSSIVPLAADQVDDNADASFTQDLATAAAVAQGSTDAHQAFLLGRIRFEGNIDMLIERRDAFDWLEAALAPVLAATTFEVVEP